MARAPRGGSSPAELDWVSRLADEVIAESERRHPDRPIICASGISPSGPIHLGNLREVMVPHLVADEIRRRGRQCEHILSWDDYDRFRKVPAAIEGIDSWNQFIGRPVTAVPPPPGSPHDSWAAHFRAAMEASLAELGVEYRGISQTQMYTCGAYRDQILLAMRERARINEILSRYRTKGITVETAGGTVLDTMASGDAANRLGQQASGGAQIQAGEPASGGVKERVLDDTSGAAEEDDGSVAGDEYYPYRPYCHLCQRDTTKVTAYDDLTTRLDYSCQCGHEGVLYLHTDSHGKLVWKVDWPMRWAYEGVVFEPSGVDHQSPGSSVVVGGQLVTEVFSGRPPIGPMYAFVGISGMAKMSSSRGGVPTPADALAIMEPALLRWLYTRRRPNQSFTIAFDAEIHRLYDEWDALERKVAAGSAQPGDLAMHARSVRTASAELPRTPRPLAYRALASAVDITGGNDAQLVRILAAMDPALEGESGGAMALDEYRPRLDRARAWVRTQLPEQDRTVVRAAPDRELLAGLGESQREALHLLATHLEDDWSLGGLTSLVYGVPKLQAGLDISEKKLPPDVKAAQRDLFVLLYRLFVGGDTGPRLPTLLLCLGPQRARYLIGAASTDQ